MEDYLAPADQELLQRCGLHDFAALWDVSLSAVDEPNVEKGGWSSVCRLELEGNSFFLKRQCNYFTRTLQRPFGEPTVAREFRNIRRYERLGIPSLQAVFYAERKVAGEHRAILLTRALDGWSPLLDLLDGWGQRQPASRSLVIYACARLIGQLHAAGLKHGCLYPKHLFLREQGEQWQGCLIDLEKTRRLWMGWRDQVRDVETFLRSTAVWDDEQQREFLIRYLLECGSPGSVELWLKRLYVRRRHKGKRH